MRNTIFNYNFYHIIKVYDIKYTNLIYTFNETQCKSYNDMQNFKLFEKTSFLLEKI